MFKISVSLNTWPQTLWSCPGGRAWSGGRGKWRRSWRTSRWRGRLRFPTGGRIYPVWWHFWLGLKKQGYFLVRDLIPNQKSLDMNRYGWSLLSADKTNKVALYRILTRFAQRIFLQGHEFWSESQVYAYLVTEGIPAPPAWMQSCRGRRCCSCWAGGGRPSSCPDESSWPASRETETSASWGRKLLGVSLSLTKI